MILSPLSHPLSKIQKKIKNIYTPLTDDEQWLKEECEKDLYTFVHHAWPLVELADAFKGGWHLEAFCYHLEALYYGQIKNLLVNIPPRLGKSTIGSAIWPMWCWIKEPTLCFLCVSYQEKLATALSRMSNRLLVSDWFQRLWGQNFQLGDVNNAEFFNNSRGGERRAACLGPGNLGHGGHIQIIDDPDDSSKIRSAVVRNTTNYYMDFVLPTRHKDIQSFRRLMMQQRLDFNDSSGHILNYPDHGWVHFMLPEEFEVHRRCTTVCLRGSTIPWSDPRQNEGDLLWPEGHPREIVDNKMKKEDLKNDMSAIRAQLQQDPLPSAGGGLDPHWFQRWKEPHLPEFFYILQSWDTALTANKDSACSACTTWGCYKDRYDTKHIMLLNIWSGKLEYPALRKKAIDLCDHWRPNLVVVEQKVSGYCIKADLLQQNIPVVGFKPERYGKKERRCHVVSPFIESGFIWLMCCGDRMEALTPSSKKLFDAASVFPNPVPGSDITDIIDSMSQALIKLIELGYLTHRPPRLDLEFQSNLEERENAWII